MSGSDRPDMPRESVMARQKKLRDMLINDPITKEWVRHLMWCHTTKVPVRTASPAMALGEKRYSVFAVLEKLFDAELEKINTGRRVGGKWLPPYPLDSSRLIFADMMYRANIVYVSESAAKLLEMMMEKIKQAYAEAGENKPARKRWPFETIWLTQEYQTSTTSGEWDALLLESLSMDFFNETTTFSILNNPPCIGHYALEQAFSDALAIFLSEKILRLSEHRLSRQLRKGSRKAGHADEAVHVLHLRSYESVSTKDAAKESAHEYCCRWLVRGHIRNQWFPSKQAHELIWIDPHVKGPEDKPFRETVRDIVR